MSGGPLLPMRERCAADWIWSRTLGSSNVELRRLGHPSVISALNNHEVRPGAGLESRALEPPRDAGVVVLFTFFGLFCSRVSNEDFRTGVTKSAAPPYRSPRRRWPSPERLTARFYISKFILSSVGSRGYGVSHAIDPTRGYPRDGARP